MINFSKPKFSKTSARLKKLEKFDAIRVLEEIGRLGVTALANNTPKDTGKTADSWSYKIKTYSKGYKLVWTNSVSAGTAPLVLLLQYGHATRSGYFLPGIDFINPALKPIYLELATKLGQEVLR